MLKFRILRGGKQAKSSITTLEFKTGFSLLRDLLGRIPWEEALERKSKGGKRPIWMNKELLIKIKFKKEVYERWN